MSLDFWVVLVLRSSKKSACCCSVDFENQVVLFCKSKGLACGRTFSVDARFLKLQACKTATAAGMVGAELRSLHSSHKLRAQTPAPVGS